MLNKSPTSIQGHWLWGNLRDFNNDSLRFLEQASTLGDITTIRFGPLKGYFINHPDLVRDILTNPQVYKKPPLIQRALKDITGENIFTGNDAYWKHSRKMMQPAFHAQYIHTYINTIIDYTEQELSTWCDGDLISFDDAITRITMRVIIKTMFGAELNADTEALGTIFSSLFQLVYGRMEQYGLVPTWLPIERNQQIQALTSTLRQIITGFIDKRRASTDQHNDLLDLLLDAQAMSDNAITDDDLIREALTIFGAGYETTAYAIIFACYALATQDDIYNRFTQEIDNVLDERAIQADDLKHLSYSENLIKESLRLYPTAWGFSRWTSETVQLGSYKLPANRTLLISPWTLGRDERWFDSALDFCPERFDDTSPSSYPRYAYIPFGGGARICIGNQLAMMEARLVTTMIARDFELNIPDGYQMKPINAAFTLRPKNGLQLRIKKRDHTNCRILLKHNLN